MAIGTSNGEYYEDEVQYQLAQAGEQQYAQSGPVMSDVSPEPVRPGQKYAQISEEQVAQWEREGGRKQMWPEKAVRGAIGETVEALSFIKEAYEGKLSQEDIRDLGPKHMANLAGVLMGGGVSTAATRGTSLGVFGGMRAKGGNIHNFVEADKLIAKGADSREVYMKTGWYKGMDDEWRFEIPGAKQSSIKLPPEKWVAGQVKLLEDVLDYPELYKAYPELKTLKVKFTDDKTDYVGVYYPAGKGLGSISLEIHPSKTTHGKDTHRSFLIHEIQHAIQEIEGFKGKGTNIDMVREQLLGEVKQRRQGLIEELRKINEEELAKPNRTVVDEYRVAAKWNDIQKKLERFSAFEAKARANPDFFRRLYHKDPGEIEARLAQYRMRAHDDVLAFTSPEDSRKFIIEKGFDDPALGREYIPLDIEKFMAKE